jgi:hypothetical protein
MVCFYFLEYQRIWKHPKERNRPQKLTNKINHRRKKKKTQQLAISPHTINTQLETQYFYYPFSLKDDSFGRWSLVVALVGDVGMVGFRAWG